MQVLMKNFARASFLPWRQPTLRGLSCFLDHSISLYQMRSEDEAKLIQGQQGGAVASPQERKNAFRDLGHNQIIFEHSETIVAHSTETGILGDVVEAVTRNGIVNIIEGTTRPAFWPRVEIDDVGAERANNGGGK
jgi:hypothetical protein